MENDENKKNPKSEKFYQMKISVLERELAEKTRVELQDKKKAVSYIKGIADQGNNIKIF